VADKFGRFLHDIRHIFVGPFYWQTKLANFIVRLTSALSRKQKRTENRNWYERCPGQELPVCRLSVQNVKDQGQG